METAAPMATTAGGVMVTGGIKTIRKGWRPIIRTGTIHIGRKGIRIISLTTMRRDTAMPDRIAITNGGKRSGTI